ncbi:MAG TPA: efflux RND transporter periplasmic adaptor subunit [Candidatus Acidoferrum sp.]|nr:efflux RND transporter periplasmic adaptor subunit [Candidatus Acidoferrum sp.]
MKTVRSRRVWLYLGLAIAAIVAVIVLSERRPLPEVPVETITRATISAAISTNGKIEPIAPHEMRALVDSHVTKVHIHEGQLVKAGQPLVDLDDSELQADIAHEKETLLTNQENLRIARSGGKMTDLAQLDSDIHKTNAEHDRLQANVTALEKLVAQQAATPQELTEARASLARTETDQRRLQATRADFVRQTKLDEDSDALLVQRGQNNLRDLQEKLASTHVKAPINGTLYSFPVHENDPIKAGELLGAVADLKQIRVRAFVDEPELGLLEPGQTLVVTWDALPNRSWTGKTDQLPRQVVPHGTRSVGELLCTLNNDDQRLIPNTNVIVRIQLRTRVNVVTAPRGAVVFEGSHRYVFVVEDGATITRLHKREIKIGIADSTTYEIVSGLNEGEVIALPSNLTLTDGMKVKTIRPE